VLFRSIDYILGNNYISQINDNKHDVIYYEVGRFLELLQSQNPNIIELYNMPEENIVYKHPLFDDILQHKDKFLSKVCRDSFGGYAVSQIKKARGLNKKIVNPINKEQKSILDFCYFLLEDKTILIKEFFNNTGCRQEYCGLVNIAHARDTYSLYYDHTRIFNYRGVVNDDDTSNDIRLSSIPKDQKPIGTLIYNKDGYIKYCKDYKEYWNWVENRNDDRYQTNLKNDNNYDSKNMMHCIRLIRMAIEIATQNKVIVKRPDAIELLKIRNGEFKYEELLEEAEISIKMLDNVYLNSSLPNSIDKNFVNDILINFRKKHYKIN